MRTDADLWTAFHAGTLTAGEWTHDAHLRVAYMYRRRCAPDEAHLLFRVHLIRLNTVHAVPESKERGYHETLTRAWLIAVGAAIEADGVATGAGEGAAPREGAESAAFLARHPEFQDRKFHLKHYTRERINSVEARARWVEPDVSPLPPA